VQPDIIALIAIYSVAVVGFGLWTSRYVAAAATSSSPAAASAPASSSRRCSPPTSARGATVNAAGLAYRDG
jgi:hypothetical protein